MDRFQWYLHMKMFAFLHQKCLGDANQPKLALRPQSQSWVKCEDCDWALPPLNLLHSVLSHQGKYNCSHVPSSTLPGWREVPLISLGTPLVCTKQKGYFTSLVKVIGCWLVSNKPRIWGSSYSFRIQTYCTSFSFLIFFITEESSTLSPLETPANRKKYSIEISTGFPSLTSFFYNLLFYLFGSTSLVWELLIVVMLLPIVCW